MQTLSREEVRNVDRFAIEQLGLPGLVLMENAGRNATDAIEHFFWRRDSQSNCAEGKRVSVVAGAGNNGGDGFVIARHLHNRGAAVRVFLVAPQEKLSGDAEVNFRVIRNLGLPIRVASDDEALATLAADLGGCDLLIDAIGGTGISGALRGTTKTAVEQLNAAAEAGDIPVMAVDIPTGLDCDTGKTDGPAVRAKLTVSFVAAKTGFAQGGAEAYTGEVEVADIGISYADVAERMKNA